MPSRGHHWWGSTRRLDGSSFTWRATSRFRHRKKLGFGPAFGDSFGHLLARRSGRAHPYPDDPMPGGVGLAVAAAVATMPGGEARGGRGWRGSAAHRAHRLRSDAPAAQPGAAVTS